MSRRVNTYGEPVNLAVSMPTVQASNLVIVGASTIEFDRGDGDKYIAVVSRSPISFFPKNNVTYLIGDYVGRDTFILYKGEEDEFSIEELSSGVWYIKVFEFNGSASTERYLITNSTENPYTVEVGSSLTVDSTEITVDSDTITADQTIN